MVNVQLEKYIETGVLAADRFMALIVDQLVMGFENDHWDEDDAFVCKRQRQSIANKLKSGVLRMPPSPRPMDTALLQRMCEEPA